MKRGQAPPSPVSRALSAPIPAAVPVPFLGRDPNTAPRKKWDRHHDRGTTRCRRPINSRSQSQFFSLHCAVVLTRVPLTRLDRSLRVAQPLLELLGQLARFRVFALEPLDPPRLIGQQLPRAGERRCRSGPTAVLVQSASSACRCKVSLHSHTAGRGRQRRGGRPASRRQSLQKAGSLRAPPVAATSSEAKPPPTSRRPARIARPFRPATVPGNTAWLGSQWPGGTVRLKHAGSNAATRTRGTRIAPCTEEIRIATAPGGAAWDHS